MSLTALHRRHAILLCLLSTLSLTGAVASQPAALPCASVQNGNDNVCLRNHNLTFAPTTAADKAMAASTTSNLAIDQAMIALTDDVSVLPKVDADLTPLKVALRNAPPVAVKTNIKNAAPTKVAYKAAPVKPELTRTQIVRNELNREKAALQRVESQLQDAKRAGKSLASLERQAADRRASISAMQSELARL